MTVVYRYICFAFVCFYRVASDVLVDIKIINWEVIVNREFEKEIIVAIEIPDYRFAQSNVCFAVDAVICHCSSVPFINDSIFFPKKCFQSKQFWFAIHLFYSSQEYKDTIGVSYPIFVPRSIKSSKSDFGTIGTSTSMKFMQKATSQITLVLPLTVNEFSRYLNLLHSLKILNGSDVVSKLLVVVPDVEASIIETSLVGWIEVIGIKIEVLKESTLFARPYSSLIQNQGISSLHRSTIKSISQNQLSRQ